MTIPDNDARITNKNKTIIERQGGAEEASPRQSAATAARNRAACSITLSIRDIGRGTRLRGAGACGSARVSRFIARLWSIARASSIERWMGGNDDSRPFEFDSRGIKGIKGVDEEIEGW